MKIPDLGGRFRGFLAVCTHSGALSCQIRATAATSLPPDTTLLFFFSLVNHAGSRCVGGLSDPCFTQTVLYFAFHSVSQ